jgi:universal stress protein A
MREAVMAHHWTKILCPVDYSETSWEALQQAAELTARSHGSLMVLHVFDPLGGLTGDALIAAPDVQEQLVRESERNLARFRAEAERIAPGRVAGESVAGEAAGEIVRFAQRGAFDLVVMGTHGRTGLRRLVLGSVAEKVVRTAPCSVLVVRPVQLFAVAPD